MLSREGNQRDRECWAWKAEKKMVDGVERQKQTVRRMTLEAESERDAVGAQRARKSDEVRGRRSDRFGERLREEVAV